MLRLDHLAVSAATLQDGVANQSCNFVRLQHFHT